MLSDPGSATIKRYGIYNTVTEESLGPNGDDPAVMADFQEYVSVTSPSERFVGIAYPGTFILDPQGVVTDRFFEDFYQERNTAASILVKLGVGAGSVHGTEISNSQVQIKTYPSDSVIARGERFTLAVEITPRPNMHVYAPGAEGYRVITLRIEPQRFVNLLPVQHPSSEIYYFEPLDERVPVYQKSFTLMQDVVTETLREDRPAFDALGTLTLTGTLEYQACDDKVCYNPMSVPLSWTVGIKPLAARQPQRP